MILVSTEAVPGREIERSVGLVRGNTVRAKHIGRDLIAVLRNLVGGEIGEYSELMTEARNEALNRMIAQAEQHGAEAVVGIRFITAQVGQGSAELVAYGTGVTLHPAPGGD